ncbi:hypothetical protein [Anatilimnocola floriformis]|uniref:hypothetical protein n=1 Tax=Anatilimnocola floriformis TaxID=2948575 RepID=UPI0020C25129|nr:hypothetical protein [Anatilimnocola floriformis]
MILRMLAIASNVNVHRFGTPAAFSSRVFALFCHFDCGAPQRDEHVSFLFFVKYSARTACFGATYKIAKGQLSKPRRKFNHANIG